MHEDKGKLKILAINDHKGLNVISLETTKESVKVDKKVTAITEVDDAVVKWDFEEDPDKCLPFIID